MSIITFMNKDIKENGQTLSVAAIATQIAIEHNYRTLIISTDYNDKTMEDSFFNSRQAVKGFLAKQINAPYDVSNGLEGLVRMFASNRGSKEVINSYTKPILKDRLDLLQSPKTLDFKEYVNMSVYFSQIAEVANGFYDLVFIDMCNKLPAQIQRKILDISSIIVLELSQNQKSILDFEQLKQKDEFYRRQNVVLAIGRYNPDSKYSAKNVGRILKERNVPLTVPYNILFADSCSDGKIVDYLLSLQQLEGSQGKDRYFYDEIKKTAERLDYLRQAQEYGLNN